MAEEIEKKFLVAADSWCGTESTCVDIVQAYIMHSDKCVLRVRIAGGAAYLTLKGRTVNITRSEFEYSIPVPDAEELINNFAFGNVIKKSRYSIMYQGFDWVIDRFKAENAGLTVAEIELSHEAESFPRPPWLGLEVSHDNRYSNLHLAQNPFCNW